VIARCIRKRREAAGKRVVHLGAKHKNIHHVSCRRSESMDRRIRRLFSGLY
jgi:hypothetical protein